MSAINNQWDPDLAENLSESDALKYRSNLLGSDLRITNFGGGNTSAKILQEDPLTGERIEVLWVKGSGGDLGTIELNGFASLYQDKLLQLKDRYRGLEHEDEMVGLLPLCTFNNNSRAASIDTFLHAFLPHQHIDHTHPDDLIAIAACSDSEAITREIFAGEIGWVPWQRPGFELGLMLEAIDRQQPGLKGIIMGGHGLISWADSSEACYSNTVELINRATAWLSQKTTGENFAGKAVDIVSAGKRALIAEKLMPLVRGAISKDSHKVGHFDDSDSVLEFVCSNDLRRLAALGTSCPDHFLRTKICPLVIPYKPAEDNLDAVIAGLGAEFEAYRHGYAGYYQRCRHSDSPAMRDPNPVIFLIPGVGMFSFAADRTTARIAAEFYNNAINVMRGAEAISEYEGLAEQEAFNVEYWLLEEAKLQRMPAPMPLQGRVAYVTGAAGAIGRASAELLLAEGACVMLVDLDQAALEQTLSSLQQDWGHDRVSATVADMRQETDVIASFSATCKQFSGIDIVIASAGIASSAPLTGTSLAMWQKNQDVLSTGYFLVGREAFKILEQQDIGGSIVFIASKNALAASKNAAAYCTAKAAELHLARCMALEGAESGIRVNSVNPDAVLQGSKIWNSEWRKERADAYQMESADLEEHYRQRSLLKQSVLPVDVAKAVLFFASDVSAKSTGNILNVDAGNAGAFTR